MAANRYVGLDVHRAARLCSAGHGGQVLISQSTSGIITDQLPAGATLRDLGEHRLKDLPRPEHIWQVIIAGVPSHFPPLRSIGARLDNLPAPATPFVGREAEVARLTAELQRPDLRLLTLTGPGGVGKTRLALQVAAHLRAAFEEGILLVALSSIRDPGLVLPTIGHILNIQEVRPGGVRETITEFLRGKEVLLVS